MCKKLFISLTALVVALMAVPAFAAIERTPHDYSTAPGGACAQCHLPHGAVQGGIRLWPVTPGAIGIAGGAIGPLCGYCHFAGLTDTNQDRVSQLFVFSPQSHGAKMNIAVGGQPRAYNNAGIGLPYLDNTGTDSNFECTTCHDVHNDPFNGNAAANRPFLRANINKLCTGCHASRMFDSGVPTVASIAGTGNVWGVANVGIANPGSHPVGRDIRDADNSGGVTPITVYRTMKVAINPIPATPDPGVGGAPFGIWQIGGHLTNGATGGINCVSCHAVHGVRQDWHVGGAWAAAGPQVAFADSHPPVYSFLAIDQGDGVVYTDDRGRTLANGHASPKGNAFCEACHQGPAVNAAYNVGAPADSRNPNPGGTTYTHPVDNMSATNNTWVPGALLDEFFPLANWPRGGFTVGTKLTTPNVICESCHTPHPLANRTRSDQNLYPATSGFEYILRGQASNVCDGCHRTSITKHHPTQKTYNNANVLYLGNATGGTDTLGCGTCHESGGAHNWTGVTALNMNPNWKPVNNGRWAAQSSDMYNTKMSITCMDCHYGLRNDHTPTLGDAVDTNYSGVGVNENTTTYGNIGFGSHVVGLLGQNGAGGAHFNEANEAAYWASFGARIGNPQVNVWAAGAPFFGNGGWSRFGGTATDGQTVLVCESCHELQPTRNTTTHLLLGVYVEELTPGSTFAAAQSNRAKFCEACHLPKGTHPQARDTVTRSNEQLATDPAVRSWVARPGTPDANVVMNVGGAGAGIINCDSCHQPHQANTRSLTYIIDATNNSVSDTVPAGESRLQIAGFGSYTTINQGGGMPYFPSKWAGTGATGKGPDAQRFCSECHPY